MLSPLIQSHRIKKEQDKIKQFLMLKYFIIHLIYAVHVSNSIFIYSRKAELTIFCYGLSWKTHIQLFCHDFHGVLARCG